MPATVFIPCQLRWVMTSLLVCSAVLIGPGSICQASAQTTIPTADTPLTITLTANRTRALGNEQFLVTQTIEYAPAVFNITAQDPETSAGELLSVSLTERLLDNGHKQLVKRWALFLQQGDARIGPARVQATLPAVDGANRALSVQSGVLELVVDATPASAGNATPVPASAVSIDSSAWVQPGTAWRAGDPVRVMLQITTVGQRAAAIPPPDFADSPHFRFYPEPAELNDTLTPEGMLGRRTESLTVIPIHPGELVLPGRQVHWFDTGKRQNQVTSVPATTVRVAAASDSRQASARYWMHWPGLLVLGLLVVTLLTAACLWLLRDRQLLRRQLQAVGLTTHRAAATTTARQRRSDEKRQWRRLRDELKRQPPDPAAIRRQLLKWYEVAACAQATGEWHLSQRPVSLMSLAASLNDTQASEALNVLNHAVYGPGHDDEPAQSQRLTTAIQRIDRNLSQWRNTRPDKNATAGEQAAPILKPLYPER